MRLTRIYTPGNLAAGQEIALTASGSNHVARVLRLRVGDAIDVFNGDGPEFRAAIVSIKSKGVAVRIDSAVASNAESPLRVTLLQGVSRAERMDWAVQKATELGVNEIVPIFAARSVVKLDRAQAAKKQAHWLNIAIGACEQCGRSCLPKIAPPIALPDLLTAIRNSATDGGSPLFRLVLDPAASQSMGTIDTGNAAPRFELLIGPEGGLDDEELSAANRAGFVSVKLGPRVLRTETAAVAALTVLQARWGDLA